MTKTALITGIRGQDAAYLSKFLLDKGYRIVGADRKSSSPSYWRLEELGVFRDIEFVTMDLLDKMSVFKAIESVRPDEIYNLAAQSYVGASFDQPVLTAEINGLSVLVILDIIQSMHPEIKLYQASSSEMFGQTDSDALSEVSRFIPRSPYAAAKLFAHHSINYYRSAHGIFACSGILFNHESPLRGEQFVTRKITLGLSRIKRGIQEKLTLGNLEARRDFGYAPDYVDGIWRMVQHEFPGDYVLATGRARSIRDFVDATGRALDMAIEWEGQGALTTGRDGKTGKVVVEVEPLFFRPFDIECNVGDATKAREVLGWVPKTSFEQLVGIMVEADMKRLEQQRNGGGV